MLPLREGIDAAVKALLNGADHAIVRVAMPEEPTPTPTTAELLGEIARLKKEIADLHNNINVLHGNATEAIGKLSKIQEILK